MFAWIFRRMLSHFIKALHHIVNKLILSIYIGHKNKLSQTSV